MLRSCWLLGTVLAINALMGVGCHSTSSRQDPSSASDVAPVPSRPNSINAKSEAAAKAHAHYAAGVIHDINDESDQALREY